MSVVEYCTWPVNAPRGPKKMDGPSTLSFEGFGDKSKEGVTMSRDTWVCSIATGERNENNASNTAVKDRTGAR